MTSPGRVLDRVAELRARGEPFALATVVARRAPQSARVGQRAVVRPDGSLEGWVGGGCVRTVVLREALDALRTGEPRLVAITADEAGPATALEGVRVHPMTCRGEGEVEIYVEPVMPEPELLIVGSSPVAGALSEMGGRLGFRVRPVDFTARGGGAPSLEESVAGLGPRSWVVVATMGEGDEEALEAVVGRGAAYVGLVASPKKAAALFRWLEEERGVGPGALEAVTSPAGLDLGGTTPEEIALSILAEIVQLRARRGGAGTDAGTAGAAGEARADADALPPDPRFATDPVCGMSVEAARSAHTVDHGGRTYHFCCPRCRKAFVEDPGAYVQAGSGAG